MRELLRTPHVTLLLDEAINVVRLVRNHAPFEHVRDIDALFLRIDALLPEDQRGDLRILLDVRDAPSRNDPEFEQALQRRARAFYRGFVRNAVLVRTAAGRLQMQRLTKGLPLPTLIFDDEKKALVYLQTGLGAP